MSTRQLWLGIATVVVAILLHAAFPRYEWRTAQAVGGMIRIDRWTGQSEIGAFRSDWGRWVSVGEFNRHAAAAKEVDRLLAEANSTTNTAKSNWKVGRFDSPIVESDLPFDPKENAANQYFADLVADYIATKARAAQLEQRVATLEGRR